MPGCVEYVGRSSPPLLAAEERRRSFGHNSQVLQIFFCFTSIAFSTDISSPVLLLSALFFSHFPPAREALTPAAFHRKEGKIARRSFEVARGIFLAASLPDACDCIHADVAPWLFKVFFFDAPRFFASRLSRICVRLAQWHSSNGSLLSFLSGGAS